MLTPAIIVLSAAACVIFLVRTIYILFFTPQLSDSCTTGRDQLPAVSILVPVRNEAEKLLTENVISLATQTYPSLEIVIIDDNSTDATPNILKSLHGRFPTLRIARGHPTLEGWLGKTFALHQAKSLAQAQWLLAVDADVVLDTEAITCAVQFALRHRLDALCILPHLEMVTFWEKVILPVMSWLGVMRVSPTQTNRHLSKYCLGFGSSILFRREPHDLIGGFEAYKNDILDDCRIMELFKENGFKVMVADGTHLLRCRMYTNLKEIVLGFAKNSFATLRFSSIRLAAFVLAELLCVFLPLVVLMHIKIDDNVANLTNVASMGAVFCLFLLMLLWGRKLRASIIFHLLYPIGHFMAVAIIIYSAVLHLTGKGVYWKERLVEVKHDSGI